MRFVVQPTFAGRRRNSPRADTLCSDLGRLTQLPAALFIADEAGITVTADGGSPSRVRALTGVGADDEFSREVFMIAHVSGLGMVDRSHIVELEGPVGDAVNHCALVFASSLANKVIDTQLNAEIQVLDHRGHVLTTASY
ncbi:MAG: hypothetical protein DI630_00925 [Gordonia sp. (in: high G+C Gram-positive bacteria)]|nr:MAG: hypothetical protein DI630_00925 [Gordonia sp. (in: high G+C Gram-positive bacteria)]